MSTLATCLATGVCATSTQLSMKLCCMQSAQLSAMLLLGLMTRGRVWCKARSNLLTATGSLSRATLPTWALAMLARRSQLPFNLPVDCDKDNGNYWFDVKMTSNGAELPSTYYTVYCEESTIYMKPTGNGVWKLFCIDCCGHKSIDCDFVNRVSSSTSMSMCQSFNAMHLRISGPGSSTSLSALVPDRCSVAGSCWRSITSS